MRDDQRRLFSTMTTPAANFFSDEDLLASGDAFRERCVRVVRQTGVKRYVAEFLREDSRSSLLVVGDTHTALRAFPEASFQTCVTSPPYWSLRDYKIRGQIGLEDKVDDYIAALVKVFKEVWRVLRDDGTLWLNIGDS